MTGPCVTQIEKESTGPDTSLEMSGPVVDQGVGNGCGAGEVDRNLAVLDLAGHARVLVGHTDGVAALLDVSGLVDHQGHVVGVQVADDVAAQDAGQGRLVHAGPRQQALDPVKGSVFGFFGQGPTILGRERGEQGGDDFAGGGRCRVRQTSRSEQPQVVIIDQSASVQGETEAQL